MYKRTLTANSKMSQWNAVSVIVPKKGQTRSQLMFNYHFIYEDNSGNHMELA